MDFGQVCTGKGVVLRVREETNTHTHTHTLTFNKKEELQMFAKTVARDWGPSAVEIGAE